MSSAPLLAPHHENFLTLFVPYFKPLQNACTCSNQLTPESSAFESPSTTQITREKNDNEYYMCCLQLSLSK